MSSKRLLYAAPLLLAVALGGHARGQGVGEQIGKKIDQGVNELGSELQQGWEEIRNAGDRLGVQARVYVRLHWDKAIQPASIDIDAPKVGTIVLKGSVPTAAAKTKAVQLANDTVGVEQVVEQLAVAQGARTAPAP